MRDRVILVVFDGAQGLDVFGPAEVFAAVSRLTDRAGYDVSVAASRSGKLATTSGVAIVARALAKVRLRRTDTVLVVGGDRAAIGRAVYDRAIHAFVVRAAKIVRRIGSVCSGAFVLARAGILDGKRAATHWSACAELARYRPAIDVDGEAIYVRHGNVWTSAGVTTGIDMALAMVEDDFGRDVADRVAAQLVLHARRPGFQSQWTDALVAQRDRGEPLGRAIGWLRGHVREAIDVERFAKHCAMSVRTLHRRCLEHLELTPRQLIERVRIDEARALLATTALPVKVVATRCGFVDAARMSRAFERTLGLAPTAYRVVAA